MTVKITLEIGQPAPAFSLDNIQNTGRVDFGANLNVTIKTETIFNVLTDGYCPVMSRPDDLEDF
jgi:hypothetical protein